MNMVFKLYLQGWVILSISAACAMVFSLEKIKTIGNSSHFVRVWYVLAGCLVIGTLSYTVFASVDKIKDRMSVTAPHTLDGMEYMKTSQYYQDGFLMDLSQDYAAIQWMQDNVEGSPVIVEGNATEYKWGNTVYRLYRTARSGGLELSSAAAARKSLRSGLGKGSMRSVCFIIPSVLMKLQVFFKSTMSVIYLSGRWNGECILRKASKNLNREMEFFGMKFIRSGILPYIK